ncbi:Uma2 family endonuclease [Aliinostoc sp. HNIBRCY26]|uniref:Uma2 family endonuclease n=1 Tax=Aliinostoc sp. HNIBRCY26 TaxID=3418997 RepID=UPI003CFC507C
MVEQTLINIDDCDEPDANLLVTEDDTPVDNLASARQQRLLVSSLYSSCQNQQFLAESNVGVYHTYGEPAIVPDIFISFDVQIPQNWWEKQNRCYLVWKFGKVPEVVVEIVSNKEGEELGKKLRIYEQMRVIYYIVYDPSQQLGEEIIRVYRLHGRYYVETQELSLEQVGLGVTLWTGEFEGRQDTWLRWCDQEGNILLTGDERAQQERLKKEEAQQLLDEERLAKEQAQRRVQLLAERLLSLGINPEEI